MSFKNKIIEELFKFIIAGIFCNILSFSIYISINKLFPLKIFLASLLSQIFGLVFNYIINSRITFKEKSNNLYKFIYFIYYFTAIFFVSFCVKFLTLNGIEYRLSWLICISIISIINFIFLKYFIFKKIVFNQKKF